MRGHNLVLALSIAFAAVATSQEVFAEASPSRPAVLVKTMTMDEVVQPDGSSTTLFHVERLATNQSAAQKIAQQTVEYSESMDLYIRRDIEGPDRGERQAALLAPGGEPGACPGMGPVRVRVADAGGEEFDIAPAGVIPEIGDQRRHDRRHAQVRRCDARNFEPCSNRALPSRRQGSLRSEIPPHSGQRTIYRPHWQSELGMPAARDDINYLNSRCGPVIGPDQSRRAATGQPAKNANYNNRKYRVLFPRPNAEEGVSRVSNLPDWN